MLSAAHSGGMWGYFQPWMNPHLVKRVLGAAGECLWDTLFVLIVI